MVKGIDKTRFVSFSVTIVKVPVPPGNSGEEVFKVVSLFVKDHVKLPAVLGAQTTVASFTVPFPPLLNVITLSL